jgi:hypothetical protein
VKINGAMVLSLDPWTSSGIDLLNGSLGLVINWLAGAWLICWSVQLLRLGRAWAAVGLGHAVAGGGCLVRKVLFHNVSHDWARGQ